MKINRDQQESIDRFLQGQLEGDNLDDFLKEIKTNPAMAKELQIQQDMAQGIEFHGNRQLRQRFRKISAEVKNNTGKTKNNKGRIIKFILAAAVIILLVCFNLFFQKPASEKLFAQFYEPSVLSITRNGDADNQLAQAEKLYNNKNYNAAIPLLQSILKTQTQNSQIQLALGNAYVNDDKPESAIQQFQSILDRNDALYADQAKWFLALTYLKTNQLEKSKGLLEELANDTGADFHEEAEDLVKFLED